MIVDLGTTVVTADGDFATKNGFHEALLNEYKHKSGRPAETFQHYSSIDSLMQALADPVDAPTDEKLKEILSSDLALRKLVDSLSTPLMFMGLLGPTPPNTFSSSSANIYLEASRVSNVNARKVGDSSWVSARVIWAGRKEFLHIPVLPSIADQYSSFPVASGQTATTTSNFTLDSTVLIELAESGEAANVELIWIGQIRVVSRDTEWAATAGATTWNPQSPTGVRVEVNFPQIGDDELNGSVED